MEATLSLNTEFGKVSVCLSSCDAGNERLRLES